MQKSLISKISSDEVLEKAYAWCCKSRADFPPNADIMINYIVN